MGKSVIVNFHDIHDIDWFEKVILLLKSKYKLISLDYLEENYTNSRKLKNLCHITVDDGHRSFYLNTYPILLKHKVPVTLFVSPLISSERTNFWFQKIETCETNKLIDTLSSFLNISKKVISQFHPFAIIKCLPIGDIIKVIEQCHNQYNIKPDNSPQNMSYEEIIEVEKSGLVTIGAHTMNHPILSNEKDYVSHKEITDSIQLLSKKLGHKIKYFAFPNGFPPIDFGKREVNTLIENKISIAVSSKTDYLRLSDNLMYLPRLGLSYGSIKHVKLKLFLGKYWILLRALLGKSEEEQRKKIYKVLKSYNYI